MNKRSKIFWILDGLRNNRVRSHFNDIEEQLNQDKPVENRRNRDKHFEKLCLHTVKTVNYYKNNKELNSLKAFPVIDKSIIKSNFSDFISDTFNREKLYSVVTSGSTGTPFTVRQNPEKKIRNTADTIYFAERAGFNLGDKLYYFKIFNDINKKSRLQKFIQNVVEVDVTKTSDGQFEKLFKRLFRERDRVGFLGYSSFYERVCNYISENDLDTKKCNVKSIISMAEHLNHKTRSNLKRYFDCPVVARYSNSEMGIIAQQESNTDYYVVNSASYIVEVLKMDSDKPAEQGEFGRIVVTDLFNFAMPMIRYDTGDIGSYDYDKKGRLILSKVEGRKMDLVYDTEGEIVSSFTITNNMWKYNSIKQYKFIQLNSGVYKFELNMGGDNFDRENELINEFKSYFGQNCTIDVEYVNEIPVLSSGKRKKVENLSPNHMNADV